MRQDDMFSYRLSWEHTCGKEECEFFSDRAEATKRMADLWKHKTTEKIKLEAKVLLFSYSR